MIDLARVRVRVGVRVRVRVRVGVRVGVEVGVRVRAPLRCLGASGGGANRRLVGGWRPGSVTST